MRFHSDEAIKYFYDQDIKFDLVEDILQINYDSQNVQYVESPVFAAFGHKNFNEGLLSETIMNICSKVREGHTVASLISNKFLTIRPFINERQYLVENGFVSKVIQLPNKSHYAKRFVKEDVSLVLKRSIMFISPNNENVVLQDIRRSLTLKKEEFTDPDYVLLPKMWIFEKFKDKCKFPFDNIATIEIGCNMSRVGNLDIYDDKLTDKDPVYFVGVKDIDDMQIKDIKPAYMLEDLDRFEKYILHEGDIVLNCKGAVLKSAIVEENKNRTLIASNNCFIIRPKEGVSSEYIFSLLNSKYFVEYVNKESSSFMRQLIKKDLAKMQIPIDREEIFHSKGSKMEKGLREKRQDIAKFKRMVADIRNRYSEDIEDLVDKPYLELVKKI